MNLLLFEPSLCTYNELQTIYSLEDFYDFKEIIEVKSSLQKEQYLKNKSEKEKS